MQTHNIFFILAIALFLPPDIFAQTYSFETAEISPNPDILEVSATFLPDTEYSLTIADEQISSKISFNMLLESGEWLMQKEDELSKAETFLKSMINTYKDITDIIDLEPFLDDASYREAQEEYSVDPDILNSYSLTYGTFYHDTRILGIVRYGDYDLILTENKPNPQSSFSTTDLGWITVIRDSSNGYRRTNALKEDMIWQWFTIDRGPFWVQFVDQLRELNGME